MFKNWRRTILMYFFPTYDCNGFELSCNLIRYLVTVASSGLGIGPQHAMTIAERLYTSGYISYPR